MRQRHITVGYETVWWEVDGGRGADSPYIQKMNTSRNFAAIRHCNHLLHNFTRESNTVNALTFLIVFKF